ncbi:MAG: VWA domain-containing protein [Pseudomonadota bacterium]
MRSVSLVRWRESQRVNAVIFLALTLLPVLIAVGFVIDRARLLGAEQAPYHGVDTAVLATTAGQPIGPLELVFVIDASDSMGGWKMEVVQSASKRLVDQLIAVRGPDHVRVGLVPYATALNAGQYVDRVLGRSLQTDRDEAWTGSDCVIERDGVAAMTDDAPAPGAFLRSPAETDGAVDLGCPSQPILPLTEDPTAFHAAMDALVPEWGTAGHLGVSWAWYILSPKWKSIWPAIAAPSDEEGPDVQKVVLFLTDGAFAARYWHSDLERGLRLPTLRALEICRAMRENGIMIFSVGLDLDKTPWVIQDPREVMGACAGDDDQFFLAATREELRSVYAAIANRLVPNALTYSVLGDADGG